MDELKEFSHLSMDSEKQTMRDLDTNLSKMSLDDAHSKEDLKNKQEKREMRKRYAERTFLLTCIWLATALGIVLLTGWHLGGFSLTQAELITLLSTTTANILGVLIIVMAYIYKD